MPSEAELSNTVNTSPIPRLDLSGRAIRHVIPRPNSHSSLGGIVFSIMFPLMLFGYEIFAPYFAVFLPDTSIGAIVYRGMLSALLVGILLFYKSKKITNAELYLAPGLFFLILYGYRLFDNIYYYGDFLHAEASVILGIYLGSIFIPYIASSKIVRRLQDHILFNIFFVLAILFLFGMFLNFDHVMSTYDFRLEIPKLNPISMATVSIGIMVSLLTLRQSRLSNIPFILAFSTVLLAIVFLSRARGPVLGLIAAGLVFLCVSRSRYKMPILVVLPLFAIVVNFVAASVMGVDLFAAMFERFEAVFDNTDRSSLGRIAAWQASLDQFFETPIFGDKIFEPTLFKYPHNMFVEALISLGIIGGLLLFVHVSISTFAAINILRLSAKRRSDLLICLVFFLALFSAQFSGAIWNIVPFWVSSSMVVCRFLQLKQEGALANRRVLKGV